MYLSMLLMLI